MPIIIEDLSETLLPLPNLFTATLRRLHHFSGPLNATRHLRLCVLTATVLAFLTVLESLSWTQTLVTLHGLGAVLSQVQDGGTERVIAYSSRVLTRAERRYCMTRRELLAVVTCVQHFRTYLLGGVFLRLH